MCTCKWNLCTLEVGDSVGNSEFYFKTSMTSSTWWLFYDKDMKWNKGISSKVWVQSIATGTITFAYSAADIRFKLLSTVNGQLSWSWTSHLVHLQPMGNWRLRDALSSNGWGYKMAVPWAGFGIYGIFASSLPIYLYPSNIHQKELANFASVCPRSTWYRILKESSHFLILIDSNKAECGVLLESTAVTYGHRNMGKVQLCSVITTMWLKQSEWVHLALGFKGQMATIRYTCSIVYDIMMSPLVRLLDAVEFPHPPNFIFYFEISVYHTALGRFGEMSYKLSQKSFNS